jgi:glucose/mannose transport system permease protein
MSATALDPGLDKAPVEHSKKGFSFPGFLRYAALIFFLAVVLIPVYVLFVTSFKGQAEASPFTAWNWPETFTFDNWKTAWTGSVAMPSIGDAILRTLGMVIPAVILSSMLGSMNGFVLSRWKFPHANIVFALILFGMFIPYQAVMVPLYQLVRVTLGLQGLSALTLLHTVYGIPITTLIFRNYYQSVPTELIEAARVDGAGMISTYLRVVLPISIPSFVVVLIWQFTSAWNDYLFAAFFAPNQSTGPVTIALNNIAQGSQLANYGGAMSAALLASIPTLIVYILLGKYFVSGLMAGSVKG